MNDSVFMDEIRKLIEDKICEPSCDNAPEMLTLDSCISIIKYICQDLEIPHDTVLRVLQWKFSPESLKTKRSK